MLVFRHEIPVKREELQQEVDLFTKELADNMKQLRFLKHIHEEVGLWVSLSSLCVQC